MEGAKRALRTSLLTQSEYLEVAAFDLAPVISARVTGELLSLSHRMGTLAECSELQPSNVSRIDVAVRRQRD